jgi:hypothetical protein
MGGLWHGDRLVSGLAGPAAPAPVRYAAAARRGALCARRPAAPAPVRSAAVRRGHPNGPGLTSLRATCGSVGPSPNDGQSRAIPQAPHAGLRA